jgi:hypothetical protein
MLPRLPRLLVAALLAVLCLRPVEAKERYQRIVAIGDIHGSFSGLVGILQTAGLINENLDWVGGDALLAQTGDMLDRGSDVKKVMDLLMRLEIQAKQAGGRVQVMLGNHEVMNLLNQFPPDYVTPEICSTFSDASSVATRDSAYESWSEWRKRFPALEAVTKEQWMERHPLGFFEYQKAIGPDGKYGKWLRGLPLVARIQDTIFMHAGISAGYADLSVKELNKRLTNEVKTIDQLRRRLLDQRLILSFFSLGEINEAIGLRAQQLNADPDAGNLEERQLLFTTWKEIEGMQWLAAEDGPLWYRGYSRLPDPELQELFDVLKKSYKVDRFVVGHTPIRSATIKSRLDGRFFLIDTGMLVSHYNGRASALLIEGDAVTQIYATASEPMEKQGKRSPTSTYSRRPQFNLQLASWAPPETVQTPAADLPSRLFLDPDGNAADFRTHEDALEFLRSAAIVSSEELSVGVSKPLKLRLEKDGVRAHAVFHFIDESKRRVQMGRGNIINHFVDSYRSQIAAYEVSRVLGMVSVPPTVERSVNGRPGSVQLWIEGAITEESRVKSRAKPLRPDYYRQQWYDKEIFHNLVNNIDPNQGNVLWDKNENVWLIDHTRSFGRDHKLAEPLRVRRCSRELWDRLTNLDRSSLQETLIPHIGKWGVKALYVRLDLIIDMLEKKIAALGEATVLFNYGEPLTTIRYKDAA